MYNLQDYLSCKRPFLSMLLRSAMCSSVPVIAMAVHAPRATAQDGNGYLGYEANTDDGTVSIFATETATSIGNNDRLLATVPLSSTAKPQRIAVSPGATYAFVSCPADKSIYLISVSNPAEWSSTKLPPISPRFNVITYDYAPINKKNSGYTPSGIVVTTKGPTNPNGPPPTSFYVWITDSSSCAIHVYEFDSSSNSPSTEVQAVVSPTGRLQGSVQATKASSLRNSAFRDPDSKRAGNDTHVPSGNTI
jgi:hypothetical protein